MTAFVLSPKRFLVLLLASSFFLGACAKRGEEKRGKALERILRTGAIAVATRNNGHCYYTYRGQEMGFEYDMAKAFAEFLGVELVVDVSKTWKQLLPSLGKEEVDVVAASMTITPSRQRSADFSKGYLPVQQMVLTHKDNKAIKGIDNLAGQTVYVRGGTSYEERLRTLKERGLDVTIKVVEDIPTEDLIAVLARGEIEVTVADSNVALLNRRYYPDIRIAFPLEKPESLGWAVKKGEKALLDKINEFLDSIQQDGTFKEMYNRYYAYVERFDHLDVSKFQERIAKRLPRYERTIKKAAEQHGFDWRLIAAVIYQESQFRARARSFSGVRGLMQLTLPTAREMGVDNRLDPRQSIMGGVKYLKKLYDAYGEARDPDRTFITLAAYNVGKGHVGDAQRIAARMKLDPNSWSSLEKTLPLLRQPKYYKASKFGYCRGAEPVFHVQRIQAYYDILKRRAVQDTRVQEGIENVSRETFEGIAPIF